MATSDKHCQTFDNCKIVKGHENLDNAEVMYDETVAVVNAREIPSPPESPGSEKSSGDMAKFNPPSRPSARHDFDSDSETDSEPERFVKSIPEDLSPDRRLRGSESMVSEISKQSSKESTSILGRTLTRQQTKLDSSENSDSDDEVALPRPGAASARRPPPPPLEGAYDPEQFRDLKVPPEMEELFQYIMRYTPQKVEIEYKLQPFVPDYVPAVGDIDAFIKVGCPPCDARGQGLTERALEHIDNLGLTVLDEPSPEQSDSALLHLQLRALSKTSSAKSTVLTKKIENAESNPKAIERWIRDVSELHLSKPAPNVNYTCKMPDIESLMQEWPAAMEAALNGAGLPPPSLACSLKEYAKLLCNMFDVPVPGPKLSDSIQALHVLFSLYLTVRSSQLYAERIKEDKGETTQL